MRQSGVSGALVLYLVSMRAWVALGFGVIAAVAVGLALGALVAAPGQPSLLGSAIAPPRLPRMAARLAAFVPAVAAPPPLAQGRGVASPWRVGVQVGHWMIDQLPDEQWRLRNDTGTRWTTVPEVEVNMQIAERVVGDLRAAGVTADLLPATVPPDYQADAFVAIHADGAGPRASGYKVAAPRRASLASKLLRDAISRAYGQVTGIPEDRYGVTFNMLGYYAFSWTRYEHAVAPATPAAIIETGYLTSAQDRTIILERPEIAALGVTMGILSYLAESASLPPVAMVPLSYPPMVVVTDQARLRYFPSDDERVAALLPAGTWVRPTDASDGWFDLVVQGDFRLSGWMKGVDLIAMGG